MSRLVNLRTVRASDYIMYLFIFMLTCKCARNENWCNNKPFNVKNVVGAEYTQLCWCHQRSSLAFKASAKRNHDLLRVPTLPGKSWKIMEFEIEIFQALKVMELEIGHEKSWRVMKFIKYRIHIIDPTIHSWLELSFKLTSLCFEQLLYDIYICASGLLNYSMLHTILYCKLKKWLE